MKLASGLVLNKEDELIENQLEQQAYGSLNTNYNEFVAVQRTVNLGKMYQKKEIINNFEKAHAQNLENAA